MATDISLLTRRVEETAISAHVLEEMGIKPMNIAITPKYATIFVSYTAAVDQLAGKLCGDTFIKGNRYAVYQADMNNVCIKWLVPDFDAQKTAKQVH
jgi:hypothetical protein